MNEPADDPCGDMEVGEEARGCFARGGIGCMTPVIAPVVRVFVQQDFMDREALAVELELDDGLVA